MDEKQRTAMQQALEALEHYVENKRPIHRKHEIIAALRAALAEQEQGRKKRKPKNSTTPLGIVCFEAYARSEVGSNRWDIAAEAVRAALAASEANEGRDE